MKIYCEIKTADSEEMQCCELPGHQAAEVRKLTIQYSLFFSKKYYRYVISSNMTITRMSKIKRDLDLKNTLKIYLN